MKMLGGPFEDTEEMIGRRCFVHVKRKTLPATNDKPERTFLEVNIYGSDHCGYELDPNAPVPKPPADEDAPF
jgi:hypothetical protein